MHECAYSPRRIRFDSKLVGGGDELERVGRAAALQRKKFDRSAAGCYIAMGAVAEALSTGISIASSLRPVTTWDAGAPAYRTWRCWDGDSDESVSVRVWPCSWNCPFFCAGREHSRS